MQLLLPQRIRTTELSTRFSELPMLWWDLSANVAKPSLNHFQLKFAWVRKYEPEKLAAGAGITADNRCLIKALFRKIGYLMPTTIESGPTSSSTQVDVNPASSIHRTQSAPV